MAKIKIVAASSIVNMTIVKEDGEFYQRTPFRDDQLIPMDANDKATFRAAACAKWGMSRVIDEDGQDEPRADENDALILEQKTLPNGVQVFQIMERLQPDWDNPLPFQHQ